MTTVAVYIDQKTRRILSDLGNGSLSSGIRIAARLLETPGKP